MGVDGQYNAVAVLPQERDLVPIEESYYINKMFYYQVLPSVENVCVVPSICDVVSMKAPLARFL
jgi:hypothetical protein